MAIRASERSTLSFLAIFAGAIGCTRARQVMALREGPQPESRCYRVIYTRDSVEDWLPTVVRLDGWDKNQRFWYGDSGDAREILKQTRGSATFSRLAGDSVRVSQVFDLLRVEFRIRERDDSIAGVARWATEYAVVAKQSGVRGARIDCPAATARAR